MRILPLLLAVVCVATTALAQDEASEARPVSRGLLKRGLLAKGKQTTTTTTQTPSEEAEYEDEPEYSEGEAQAPSTEATPSSTEGKKLLVGNRPFRSNTDLLETLKRRRAQAAEAKLHGHSSTQAPAAVASQDSPVESPVKSNYSKKRYNTPARESNNEEALPSAKPSRLRFGRPSSKAVQEPEAQQEQTDSSSPPARSGRAFSRRGGN